MIMPKYARKGTGGTLSDWKNVKERVDGYLRGCYDNICINSIEAFQVHPQTRSVGERGNQVRVLSDPVTVFREGDPKVSIVPQGMRRRVNL